MPKILDEITDKEVVAVIAMGGSLVDAADYVGVCRDALFKRMRSHPELRERVDQAAAQGKLRLIAKVGSSSSWQASAWMLERKFAAEFGRKSQLDIGNSDGKPLELKVEQEVKHTFDMNAFAALFAKMAQATSVVDASHALQDELTADPGILPQPADPKTQIIKARVRKLTRPVPQDVSTLRSE